MVKLTEALVLARSRSQDLESIRKLNCWGSELDDVSIVRKLPNIEVASLSVNEISTLADFRSCPNLQELYIRKNKIRNLSDICYLKNLPKLRSLWLADNPCAVGGMYRMTVLKNLPNLTKLDNIVVEEDELNDAIEQGKELQAPKSDSKPTLASALSREEKADLDKTLANSKSLSLTETNKIRVELGLKPLDETKITTPTKSGGGSRNRNANVLAAVMSLVKELDGDGLEHVIAACRSRIEDM